MWKEGLHVEFVQSQYFCSGMVGIQIFFVEYYNGYAMVGWGAPLVCVADRSCPVEPCSGLLEMRTWQVEQILGYQIDIVGWRTLLACVADKFYSGRETPWNLDLCYATPIIVWVLTRRGGCNHLESLETC